MPSRIGDALHWYATYTPNKIAIISSSGTQTYAQLWSRVCRLDHRFHETGLMHGIHLASEAL
jgi:non-ribosomal peptide synthetase component E (peptide arylation enzyme)